MTEPGAATGTGEPDPVEDADRQHRRGVTAAVTAYTLWGLVPLFWPLVQPAGAVEILAHRIVWSLLVAGLLAVLLRVRWLWVFRHVRTWRLMALGSAFIAVNWGTYIWAVNNGQVVQAALGYYINPILSIVAGVLILRERLSRAQWVAVGVAAVAVLVLTVDYGRPPVVALVLATSFASYGLIKKHVQVPAVASLCVESAVLTPLALGYLIWLSAVGTGTFTRFGAAHDLLLVATGVVTAVPLILFAVAAPRIPLSTMGLLQYVAPTLQFGLGVLYFGEAMSPGRWLGFGLVWLALLVISVDGGFRLRRAGQRARIAHRANDIEPPRDQQR